ncbi:bifunctional helix-turn-helix transcriptional regulator/GNAT family N-acetyltransferase [Dongia deserti]|uniref:bifunctional helix-turn-helix transcriptional regulator/GNAT family N-acetyltransferase n=1 Tax=Dongia deserti TaxID=2268030 RepID=UPI000E6528FA|nr:helix-turn-helix domain-containing GNAT family N-acetyltransferase [Dongia deserti]
MEQQALCVEAVRRFSRFYTRQVGVLHEGYNGSEFSLTEARIIYELAHREAATASDLAKYLGLDPGYLSRVLKNFQERGLVQRQASDVDARQYLLSLTELGQMRFAELNARSRNDMVQMLGTLTARQQQRLVSAMSEIETLLSAEPERGASYILRPHQPGDIGWAVQKHGELYAREYGFDESFEALAAEIGAKFLKEFDPKKERAWIAEKNSENVGCVFLVRQSDEIAKLRMLLVDPKARGLGIGKRLVEECIRFARDRGYKKITLWTNDILVTAGHIYKQCGFKLVAEERHHSFGHDLVGQTWELDLRAP